MCSSDLFKNNEEIFVTNVFGPPRVWRLENYVRAVSSFSIFKYFLNSVVVTLFSVFFIVVIALMFSYATARMKVKHEASLRMYIMTGLFIPANIVLIPLSVMMNNLGLFNTRTAVIIAYIAFNLPFATVIFYGFFRSIPYEMEEAACIDGASVYLCFRKIIMPIMIPGIASVVIFDFLGIWNEFNIALVLLVDDSKRTLPLGLQYFVGQFKTDWGAMGASMVIASVPTIIVYLIFHEKFEKAMTVGGAVKG